MGDISTKDYNTRKVKVTNSNTNKTIDAILDRTSKDGKTITLIIANTKVIFNRMSNRPGQWLANHLGMELIAHYVP